MRRHALTIHQRLLLIALLPAALLTTLVAGIVLYHGTSALDDTLRDRATGLVSFLAPAAEYGVISGHRGNLATLTEAAIAQPQVSAVAIYNDQGQLLASSGRFAVLDPAALRAVGRPSILSASSEVLAAVAPVAAVRVNLDDPFAEGADSPEPARPQVVGWVHVEIDARPSARQKLRIIGVTVGLALVGLALTAVLGIRLARSISRPVASLVQGVGRMAGGVLDVELEERATDAELAALERGFNAMARAISDSHRTLQSRVDEATAQLVYQARHDPLTGLPNRRVFEERLDETLAASRRAGDHGALCFVDLDRFKIVNDTCGHAAGDELLRRVAKLIRKSVREQDVVCRIGGDEFALILRGCTRADALHLAEQLRAAIAAFRFSWEGRRFSVGASIGFALIDGRQTSASELLVAADLACYEAKKNGRDQVVEYDARRHAGEVGGPGSAAALDPAAEHALELHLQSIVPLGPVAGGGWVEILLRVRGPGGELHFPHDYLSRFEHDGRGLELDMRVAELGCGALARLHALGDANGDVSASLNLSRSAVRAPAPFLARLRAALDTYAIEARQIVLELPVEFVEQYPEECAGFCADARALGCRIAVQQVDGAGIARIAALRPDYVKISLKALIAKYGLEAGCHLAQALTGMAATLSIPSVASEVEDPALVDSLHAFGFELAQGNAIAPPAPLSGWRAAGAPPAERQQGAG